MYRIAPTGGHSTYNLQYPFYSTTATAEYPEPLSVPVDVTKNDGLVGLPDPKKFDLEYDDTKNLYH